MSPRKKSFLTVTDQFCGAGGSSLGASAAGLEIRMAMNHWDLAAIVMLLPANRCEQRFWQQYVEPFRDGPVTDGIRLRTRFLKGRPRFAAPDAPTPHKGDRPPFGCVLLIWCRQEGA